MYLLKHFPKFQIIKKNIYLLRHIILNSFKTTLKLFTCIRVTMYLSS